MNSLRAARSATEKRFEGELRGIVIFDFIHIEGIIELYTCVLQSGHNV
jgi:hypothetical protein